MSKRAMAIRGIIVVFVIAIFLFASYAKIALEPYLYFHVSGNSGTIDDVNLRGLNVLLPPEEQLQLGDRILRVNGASWQELIDKRMYFYPGAKQGEPITLLVEREGSPQPVEITWMTPDRPEESDMFSRIAQLVLLPGLFFLFSLAALLFFTQWRRQEVLFVAFCVLTMIFTLAGILSTPGLLASKIWMRSTAWLMAPVYFHFHWLFPRPLKRLPSFFLPVFYTLAGIMAFLELLKALPASLFYLGFGLAILVGIMVPFLIRTFTRRRQKKQPAGALLGLLVSLYLAPLLLVIGLVSSGKGDAIHVLLLMSLTYLPMSYFLLLYRRQYGRGAGIEKWLLAGGSLFYILVVVVFFIVSNQTGEITQDTDSIWNFSALAFSFGLMILVLYPVLVTQIERYIASTSHQIGKLMNEFAARIPSSLELPPLIELLEQELFPALMIRQAAILRLDEQPAALRKAERNSTRVVDTLLKMGVESGQIPRPVELHTLLQQAGQFRQSSGHEPQPYPWIRMVIPLLVEGKRVGVCLIGERDLEDSFSADEVTIIQILMNLLATALKNIDQAQALHTLNRLNMEKNEAEHLRLAQSLHDEVLGQLAVLRLAYASGQIGQSFESTYSAVVERIRDEINGLRPHTLNYGLGVALEELADNLIEKYGHQLQIRFEPPKQSLRYAGDVELHVFRIIQQACHNSIFHAHAKCLMIKVEMESGKLRASVRDDGMGFDAPVLDMARLLEQKHFGLVGMYERAHLIGAEILIESSPGQGTTVFVDWAANRNKNNGA